MTEAPARFVPARSLYVHVPFCRSRCAYCDFHSTAMRGPDEGRAERVIRATLDRAAALARRFGDSGGSGSGRWAFDTVYVGGGTPTVLGPALLDRLLAGIEAMCAAAPLEWTVEANPESFGPETLEVIRRHPVTRISLGIQSLDDGELRMLGRHCTARRNEEAVALASGSGLRLSADLLAALPRPRGAPPAPAVPSASLAASAGRLADSGFSHLSIYDLVVEEGTAMAGLLADRTLDPADPDLAAEARSAAESALAGRGIRRYEISNYSAPGGESLHNMAYWTMKSWIGAGSGASSTLAADDSASGAGKAGAALRIDECRDLRDYASGRAGEMAAETLLAPADTAFETVMMAFRTTRGLDAAAFWRRFGIAPEKLIGSTLEAWKPMIVEGTGGPGFIALDGRGMDLANRFLVDCMEEMEKAWR